MVITIDKVRIQILPASILNSSFIFVITICLKLVCEKLCDSYGIALTHAPVYAIFIYIALPCRSQNMSNVLNTFCSVVFFLLLSICNSGFEGPQVTVINGIVEVDDDFDPWVYWATDLETFEESH